MSDIRRQPRHVILRKVQLDLPPDIATRLTFIAKHTGVPVERPIVDLLRDGLTALDLTEAA